MLRFMGSKELDMTERLNRTDNNKSNGKQVKETVSTGSQNQLLPAPIGLSQLERAQFSFKGFEIRPLRILFLLMDSK